VRDPPRQARSVNTHPRQTKESPARRHDHIHDVLAAALSVRIDREWTQASRGSCILIPGGAPHDVENRDMAECSFLCINAPAGFERKMPGLVAWFARIRWAMPGPIEPGRLSPASGPEPRSLDGARRLQDTAAVGM
jgi:hypothetical protein